MSTCAVIVSYHPDAKINRNVAALLDQVDEIVIVDNGSGETTKKLLEKLSGNPQVSIIYNRENLGIAEAQNIGAAHARRTGADYVALFDQDSIPAPDMIKKLVSAAVLQAARGVRVAAVGPRYLDERHDNPPPFIRIKGLKLERQACIEENSVVEVDYLISSGCLIPMTTLAVVGGMREELFIDYVDIEWGLRAGHAGYKSFGCCAAKMNHTLGDVPIEFRGKKYPVHSPLRHYYHFRNAVWLYKQPWTPMNWKLADGWRLILKFGLYTILAKPHLQQFKMMALGIWHGLLGKMGALRGSRKM